MRPTIHVLSTVLAYAAVRTIHDAPLEVLLWACFLTVFVNVADHGLFVATLKHPTAVQVRELLRGGRIPEAYRLYYENRRRILSFTYLHNLPVLFAITALTAYYQSLTLGLRLLLHYALDIIDHYNHEGNLRFWLRTQ